MFQETSADQQQSITDYVPTPYRVPGVVIFEWYVVLTCNLMPNIL